VLNAPIQTKIANNKVYPNTDCENSNSLELGVSRKTGSITPVGFDSDAETIKKAVSKPD